MKCRYLLLPFTLFLHPILIYFKGYFLSSEFVLYPYLVSKSLLPYKDIIDQHFPAVFFGPFSLPSFLTTNPWPLLALFFTVLFATDVFFYFTLLKHKVKTPKLWTLVFILLSTFLSGNILWVETFVNLYLSLWLFLSPSKKPIHQFVNGFFISQILLLRPTFAPAILLLILSISKISPALVFGGLMGISIPALYLYKNSLLNDFYSLAFIFNKEIYPKEAMVLPSKRNLLILATLFFPAILEALKKHKYIILVILTLSYFLAFPRFGYEHLQPLALLSIFFLSKISNFSKAKITLYIAFISLLLIISISRNRYGNYYLSPEVVSTGERLKELPGDYLYILGAPDLLYQLSEKTPPAFTYIPSLPWYLHQQQYAQRIIGSLIIFKPPILIDETASVDDKNILEESGPVWEYIKIHYEEKEKIERFTLFTPKK